MVCLQKDGEVMWRKNNSYTWTYLDFAKKWNDFVMSQIALSLTSIELCMYMHSGTQNLDKKKAYHSEFNSVEK